MCVDVFSPPFSDVLGVMAEKLAVRKGGRDGTISVRSDASDYRGPEWGGEGTDRERILQTSVFGWGLRKKGFNLGGWTLILLEAKDRLANNKILYPRFEDMTFDVSNICL